MAELLLRMVDRANPDDPYKDVKLSKRGDVVCVMPDGWPWSAAEQTNPHWRIFRWPTLSVEDCDFLLAQEEDTRAVKVGVDPMLQRRGYMIDVNLEELPSGLQAYLDDDSRAAPWFNVPSPMVISGISAKKDKLPDPNVLE